MSDQRKNVVSFCVWEKNEEMEQGAIENAKTLAKTFPGWHGYFYMYKDVDESVSNAISEQENCSVFLVSDDVTLNGVFWRYIPLSDVDTVSSVISRDPKARICDNDYKMVSEWIHSPYQFHLIKNESEKEEPIIYPYHWGVKLHGPINTVWLYHYLTKEDLFKSMEDYHHDIMLFSFYQGFHFLFANHILPTKKDQ